MISSQPCRTAASTATLTLAVPTIARRSAAARAQQLMRLHRDGHLGAGGEQRNLGGPLRGDDFVGAGGAAVGLVMGKPQLRQVLPGERENARRLRMFERELPAFDRLDRVAGTEDVEVWDGAQGGEVLDRLVGRAV